MRPKISVITVTYNSAATLPCTLQSVAEQTYPDIEHIIIDGASTDDSPTIIRQWAEQRGGCVRWLSEPDHGLYDAMNKGIAMATGDIVGILNSDDYFTAPDILERVARIFESDAALDAVYGDVHFIHASEPQHTVRYYSSRHFRPAFMRFGFLPAHPSLYVRREVYERVGLYKTDYRIAADYEMMVRLFCVHHVRFRYLPVDFVTMRTGGLSTSGIRARLISLREDTRACRENGIYTHPLLVSLKFLYKVFELRKPW